VSEVIAPMGGKVIDVKVNVGDAVTEGDEVICQWLLMPLAR
jgi:biotin carboxyl carrier protein